MDQRLNLDANRAKKELTLSSETKNLEVTHDNDSVDFVELLGRSHFSFLHGASSPKELIHTAKENHYQGLALCDLNGFYGIVRAHEAAHSPSHFDSGRLKEPLRFFQYIVGTELTLYDASPVILLPMSHDGYTKLSVFITKAKKNSPKGTIKISLHDVIESSDDCILVPLPPWNTAHLKLYKNAFKDRVYLPVWRDFTWESLEFCKHAFEIENSLGIELIATNRPFFHSKDRKPLHDVLTCILHKTTLNESRHKLLQNAERYLKSKKELQEIWKDRPDLLRRTLEVAKKIKFSLDELRYKYPQEGLPENLTAAQFLRKLTSQGLLSRYPEGVPPEALELAEHELKTIIDLEYEDYFLTLWEICEFAKNREILFQGRGSAANSIVCYCLGLTNIDPVRFGLLFERFISRERGEPPDIDIDFEHERREEVIQYIYQKYGRDRAAMVCTVICYRSRMAVRESAKALGLSLEKINAIIKFMGREGLSRLLDQSFDLSHFCKNIDVPVELMKILIQIAVELRGTPRHLGIHSGGFLIGHRPICELVPIEHATMNERSVIQFNKDDLNTLKMMKVDVLSLGMLTALRKSLHLLQEKKSLSLSLATIPHEDPATYKMIQAADTVGTFQIESRAQMSLLPRLKPKTFYDLVIEVAIVRPGPIQGGMVHPFLRRRQGLEKTEYAHPLLKSILQKTEGVPIFQEQVMQIAVKVAGFTPGESDELRRIMSSSWKSKPIMTGLRQRLLNGMISKGVSLAYAEQIYKTIEGFSSYGFPESHAASFALLTYASCYLRCHYPDVYVTSILNSQPMGFYSPRSLIADAQQHGVHFLEIDIQSSEWDYTLEQQAPLSSNRESIANPPVNSDLTRHQVRVGFRSLQGLSKSSVDKFVENRKLHGRFLSLEDFVRRSELPRHLHFKLAAAGAYKAFMLSPREALWKLASISFDTASLNFAKSRFQNIDTSSAQIPQESCWDEAVREYSHQGFSLHKHPMALLRNHWKLEQNSFLKSSELTSRKNRSTIRVAGLMSMLQKPPTAKGMCFLSLEDEAGLMNIIITPDLYEKHRLLIMNSPFLAIEGTLENQYGLKNIKAKIIRCLPTV